MPRRSHLSGTWFHPRHDSLRCSRWIHPDVGLSRPSAALLFCHFAERDAIRRLGATVVHREEVSENRISICNLHCVCNGCFSECSRNVVAERGVGVMK